MTFRDNLIKEVLGAIDLIESKRSVFEQTLVDTQNKTEAAVNNLVALEQQADAVRAWSESEKSFIAKEKNEFSNEVAEFENYKSGFIAKLNKLSAEENILVDSCLNLRKEIKDLEVEKETLVALTENKGSVMAELTAITLKIAQAKEDLSQTLEALYTAETDYVKARKQYEEANKDTIAKFELDRKNLIEREVAIAKQKKELDAKEADLKTIEMRWKKIYETKGVGFKV